MADNGPVDDSGEAGGGEVTIEFVEHAEGPHEVPAAGSAGRVSSEAPQDDGAPASTPEEERTRKLEEQLLRLRSDFENYKRRAERERAEAGDRAQGELLKGFLPVLDNLDRALAILEAEAPAEWCRGMELVRQAFVDVFARAGAEPMDAVGKPFDPQFHDAVTLCRNETVADGAVAEVIERGYLFRGRLLRPAKVRVNRLVEAEEEKGNG